MSAERCSAPIRAAELVMYEEFSSTSEAVLAQSGDNPCVHRIVHEMGALQASLQVVEHGGSREEARLLGRTYLGRLEPRNFEERVIEAALCRILGRSVSPLSCEPTKVPWQKFVSETVALSWLSWAAGDRTGALDLVKSLRACQKKKETFAGKDGAIHLLTLYFWSQAVTQLAKGDHAGARRFFKRAIELGSQFGTDSHPMISWAYAASFFEDARR